jgi:hypothetical protein
MGWGLARRTPRRAPLLHRRALLSTTHSEGPHLARRQSPQTFEKRRRERDKKLKKEAKQQDRIWRNAEKRDAKLQAEDPEAFRKLLEQRRKDEEAWYY